MSSKNTDIESALVSVHLALAQLCVVFYHISYLVLSVINDRLSALRPHKSSKCVLTNSKTIEILDSYVHIRQWIQKQQYICERAPENKL